MGSILTSKHNYDRLPVYGVGIFRAWKQKIIRLTQQWVEMRYAGCSRRDASHISSLDGGNHVKKAKEGVPFFSKRRVPPAAQKHNPFQRTQQSQTPFEMALCCYSKSLRQRIKQSQKKLSVYLRRTHRDNQLRRQKDIGLFKRIEGTRFHRDHPRREKQPITIQAKLALANVMRMAIYLIACIYAGKKTVRLPAFLRVTPLALLWVPN